MQKYIGKSIDREKSYAFGLQLAGFVPALAVLALLVLWPRKTPSQQASTPKDSTHG